MDKKIAGLLGAVAALTSLPAAQAATNVDTAQAMRASSYADLLTPVSNAMEVLKADDAARAARPATEAQALDGVQVAQYHHHHHHHHRRVIIIRRHRHHHHNWRPMRRYHHHHHHHHSHYMALPRDDA